MDRSEERVALIEIGEREGRAQRVIDIHRWPIAIGRALDNDIVLDDPHAAPHHARLQAGAEGALVLVALPSRNGVNVDERHAAAGATLPLPAAGAVLRIGATRLRVRLRGEELAPEMPLGFASRHQRLGLGLAMVALLVEQTAGQWLALDPGADFSDWLPLVLGLPIGIIAWCGLWALMSKLFQHRFDFAGHLRIAVPWLLAIALVQALLPQLAASLGWSGLWYATPPLAALLGLLLVYAQLVHVLPLHRRAVGFTLAVLALAGSSLSLALVYRSTDSLSSAPYMSTLPLPALRLGGTAPVSKLVQDMAPLAERLARRVQKAREDAEDDGNDGGGD